MYDKQYIVYRYNMDLADIALFRTIASVGSLSAAARQMGTTPMLVSRRLAGLEAELGARLFHRTTRSLSLTPEGEAFLPHAVTLMEARDLALDSVSPGGSGLSGVLKITAPNVIGHSVVVPVVAELIADNPALRVDLTLNDGVIDIATAGLDVAIRVALMKPSEMIATKVADNPFTLIASPDYFARFGEPATTEDLVSHPCIKLHAMDHWPFTRGGEMHRVRISGPLSASTVDAVRAACIAGVGIAMLTYWDVHEQIERGELQRIVLSDVKPLEVGIWAVFPTRTQMPARVRAFIDALRDRLLAAVDAPLKVTRRATRPGKSQFKSKSRTPARLRQAERNTAGRTTNLQSIVAVDVGGSIGSVASTWWRSSCRSSIAHSANTAALRSDWPCRIAMSISWTTASTLPSESAISPTAV